MRDAEFEAWAKCMLQSIPAFSVKWGSDRDTCTTVGQLVSERDPSAVVQRKTSSTQGDDGRPKQSVARLDHRDGVTASRELNKNAVTANGLRRKERDVTMAVDRHIIDDRKG